MVRYIWNCRDPHQPLNSSVECSVERKLPPKCSKYVTSKTHEALTSKDVLCSEGRASNFSENSSQYQWVCSNQTASVQCNAKKKITTNTTPGSPNRP